MNKKVNSGIGGQAVMEGIMMRNKNRYSIAVRTEREGIKLKTEKLNNSPALETVKKIPIVRGFVAFIDSLVTGMSTLMYSAELLMNEEDAKAAEAEKIELTEADKAKKKRQDNLMMAGVVVVAIALAVGIFIIVPYYISSFLERFIPAGLLLSAIEAVIRVVFFLLYIIGISRLKDIQRVFMYHGAEHKCINCVEYGRPLTVDNVRSSSRLHKRCGTSFLFFVLVVSIIFIMFIQVDSHAMRVILRLAFIPLIAGVSYEIIRWAGCSDNKFVTILSKPGMGLQKITTAEPDDEMIEVGIAAVEAVFDWKVFLKENFGVSPEDEFDRFESEAAANG